MSLGVNSQTANVDKLERDTISSSADGRLDFMRSDLEQRCTRALLTVLPHLRQLMNRERDGESPPITFQQYSVLKALSGQKLLISELADMLRVSRPTMSRIIDGLEGRRRLPAESGERRPKLVERLACQDDHRLVYACITPEGEDILRRYHLQAEDNIARVLREVPPSELPVLLSGLEALAQVLSEKV